MNFRQLTVAMAMSAVVATSAAHAASSAEYLAVREKTLVTPLQTTNEFVKQFAAHAGQVIELDGVVNEIVPNGTQETFVLRLDPRQSVLVAARQHDADIALGARLRVLARIPAQGELLEGMSVTREAAGAANQAAVPPANTEQSLPLAKSALDITPAGPDASPLGKTATEATAVKAVTVAEVTPAASTAAGHRRHHGRRGARTQGAAHKAAAPTRTFSQKVQQYAQRIRAFNHSVNTAVANAIATHVLLKSQKYGVDPRLVFALIAKESRFNPKAVSPVGAQGLGQLMPSTAAAAGIHAPFDVAQNIEGTVRYLARQLASFGGNIAQALAAYNAGPASVIRYGGVPPFSETVNYVRVISSHYEELKVGLL